jgi:PKD repeat protein
MGTHALQRLLILLLIVALTVGSFENVHAPHPPDHTPPVANAGPDQLVDEDTEVQFDGSASTDNIRITKYVWTFVDSTPKALSGITPTYTFLNPGNYTVTLNVTDAVGNWATDMVTLTVRDITPPIISMVTQSPPNDVGIAQLVNVSASIVDVGTGVKNASLTYSHDNGSSWERPRPMIYNSTSGLYETIILGHIYGTRIIYKITAYDNAGNVVTENNAGQYYSYEVIPEFSTIFAILLFSLMTLAVMVCKRRISHSHIS